MSKTVRIGVIGLGRMGGGALMTPILFLLGAETQAATSSALTWMIGTSKPLARSLE